MTSEFDPIDPLRIDPKRSAPRPPTQAEIDSAIAYVDGVNGSAGHHLSDPFLRDLLRRYTTGEITAEEYERLGMAHLNGQPSDE